MTEYYTTGTWRSKPGSEQDFIDAWTAFAGWAAGMPGAGTLRLTRDAGDPARFVSMGRWANQESVLAWKRSPEFRERIGSVLQHIDGFEPTELAVVETVAPRAGATLSQAGGAR